MKTATLIFMLIMHLASLGQYVQDRPSTFVTSIGLGGGINTMLPSLTAEIGTRPIELMYSAIKLDVRASNYPGISIAPIVGTCWSWNNNAGHDLTTIFYTQLSLPLMSNEGFKRVNPSLWGIGVKHYVYEGFVDISYQQKQYLVTFGWSFGQLYR